MAEAESVKKEPWICKPEAESEPLEKLTVGSIYRVNCSGDFVDHSRQSLVMNLDKESAHRLHLIEVLNDSPTNLLARVTSYKTGKLDDLQLQFVDGNKVTWSARVEGVEIQSVIDPEKGPPQPFGPFGPLAANLDWWFYALLISIGVVALGILFKQSIRLIRRKNFFIDHDIEPENAWLRAFGIKSRKGIKDYSKDRQLYLEFNKSIRELTKSLPMGEGLNEKDIRNFCSQLKRRHDKFFTKMLWVPVQEISINDLLNEIKKQDRRFYQKYAAEIKRVKSEIDRSVKQPERMTAYDCQQLLQMSRKSASLVYTYKKGEQQL